MASKSFVNEVYHYLSTAHSHRRLIALQFAENLLDFTVELVTVKIDCVLCVRTCASLLFISLELAILSSFINSTHTHNIQILALQFVLCVTRAYRSIGNSIYICLHIYMAEYFVGEANTKMFHIIIHIYSYIEL